MQFGHNGGDFWYDQPEAVAQLVSTRLLLYRGEWFLDAQEGTPWGGFPLNQQVVRQGQILGDHTQFTRDVALQTRVMATQGVQSIDYYFSEVDPNTRTFGAQLVITTMYGRFALQVVPMEDRAHFILSWSALTGSDPL
jgi:hypothetical protein